MTVEQQQIIDMIKSGNTKEMEKALFLISIPDKDEYSEFNMLVRRIEHALFKSLYHPEYVWHKFANNNLKLIYVLRRFGLKD